MYNLRFLGGASIEGPEGPVAGPAAQARRLAFLACLAAARGKPVSRDTLIAMLWPESAPESARHSARETIYVLNHELNGAPVEVVGNALRIDPARCPSDVAAFQAAIEAGDLERAVELYGGGFLDGLFLKDALGFEEWAHEERDRFARAYAQALEELAEHATQQGDHSRAASRWRELVAHDPSSARATVRLMESLAAAGNRAEALRQADAHAVRMREEFDATPERAVTDLADRLRSMSTEGIEVRVPVVADQEAQAEPGPSRHAWRPLALTALIIGLAVWYVAFRNPEPGPAPATASIDASAVAVLPFSVRGDEMAVLREGMVDLLSTGLDGVAGLRTISPATLFARWRESVSGTETPDLPAALDVARRSGARFAVMGSAVSVGQDIRLVADVYHVDTSEPVGQARAEGSSDDVLTIVDRLAVELLRVILERGEGELPDINLARLTTESPAALQAFLEGEVLFRQFDMARARAAYERASASDSTFALAHYRLGYVQYWLPGTTPQADHHFGRAAEFGGRLPPRAAVYVRTLRAWTRKTLDWVDPLHQAVQRYPDDAHLKFLLGEMYLHTTFATAEEIDRLFEQAVELDPGNATYLSHHLDMAWWLHGDSAHAARLIEQYERIAPDDTLTVGAGRLALDLAFGDSLAQTDAMDRLRLEDWEVIREVAQLLYHPRYAAFRPVTQLLLERGEDGWKSGAAGRLFSTNATWYGRLGAALPYLNESAISRFSRARALYHAWTLGLPIPKDLLEEALDPALIDPTARISMAWLVWAGAFAADRGQWSEHARAIDMLEQLAQRTFQAADSIRGMMVVGSARALEGYGLVRQGYPIRALPLLEDSRARFLPIGRLWLGRLYEELDRLRDAERVYGSYFFHVSGLYLSVEPLVRHQLGRVYEQLGEPDKALESYEYFAYYWRQADPELQPMVEEARQAILRLVSFQRE